MFHWVVKYLNATLSQTPTKEINYSCTYNTINFLYEEFIDIFLLPKVFRILNKDLNIAKHTEILHDARLLMHVVYTVYNQRNHIIYT